MTRLDELRYELKEIAEKEYYNLCRIYRMAKKAGCSQKTLSAIAEEREWFYNAKNSFPERLLDWKNTYTFEYTSLFKH